MVPSSGKRPGKVNLPIGMSVVRCDIRYEANDRIYYKIIQAIITSFMLQIL